MKFPWFTYFIITAINEDVAQRAKKVIKEFLIDRGLELSESKTKISVIDNGFDFLGWNFRKYKGKLIVKPSKKSIDSFVRSLSDTILKQGKSWKQKVLIQKLNQQIRGWANYHQSVVANEAFSRIDFVLYNLLYHWAKRRHSKKGKYFVTAKYWRRIANRSWVVATNGIALLRVDHIPIVRHIKVQMNVNPYIDVEYFAERKFKLGMRRLSGRFKHVWEKQNGKCFHCRMPLDIMEERTIYFKIPKFEGGQEIVTNMAYVHNYCNTLNK